MYRNIEEDRTEAGVLVRDLANAIEVIDNIKDQLEHTSEEMGYRVKLKTIELELSKIYDEVCFEYDLPHPHPDVRRVILADALLFRSGVSTRTFTEELVKTAHRKEHEVIANGVCA